MLTSRQGRQVSMFVLAGWLFADLFIGLALLFAVGNTQGTPPPQPTPTATHRAAPTPRPTATPSPPSIDPNDLMIPQTVSDPAAIAGHDKAASNALLNAINQYLVKNHDTGKRVGIVLIYSGQTDALSSAVQDLLPSAGHEFKGAIYRHYFSTDKPTTYLLLDVFFFR